MTPVPATISYLVDYHNEETDDQGGRIKVVTPTGEIHGTWQIGSVDLQSNTTREFTDEEAWKLLDSTDLCQGDGTYTATITTDEYGWYVLDDVVWAEDQGE